MQDILFRISSLPAWLVHLFNPPPLASMSVGQKIGRVLLFTAALTTLCLISAMVLAAGIFLVERSPRLVAAIFTNDLSQVDKMAGIMLLSIGVNSICVCVLLQIRRLDRGLMKEVPCSPKIGPPHAMASHRN
jgi:hypothetical protein